MHTENPIQSPARWARVAGVLYLIIILCGVGSEALVRGQLIAPGDWERTVTNLTGNEMMFRLGIMVDVIMALADVGLGILLYHLLAPGGSVLSLSAMLFRLMQAAIIGLNLLNLHRVMDLAMQGSAEPWLGVLGLNLLDAHATGYDMGLFFFAINCFLVGALIIRSGWIPGILGYGIFASGLVYLTGSALHMLIPAFQPAMAPAYLIPLIAESAFCVWLLAAKIEPQVIGKPSGVGGCVP